MSAPALEIEEQVPLAPFTTLGIGGPARYFARVSTVGQIREGLEWAATQGVPFFILGGGSNLLVADRGFAGLVLRIELRGIEEREEGDSVILTAAAGEEWDSLVAYAVERELAGIECLSGIPGNTGSSPIQNIGAYGQEVRETIESVEVLDLRSNDLAILTNDDCRFGYRRSLFKNDEPGRYVVLAARYRLVRGGAPAVRYPDLQRFLDGQGSNSPSLQQVREAVIAIRKRKGMVLDPSDPDSRSAGSFFMNPVLSAEEFETLVAKAGETDSGKTIPAFPAAGGEVKLSAAWLIENAGFSKGLVHGGVGLSTKHTLAVVNRGGGTSAEVLELVAEIQGRVRERFGIGIEPEPNLIGF